VTGIPADSLRGAGPTSTRTIGTDILKCPVPNIETRSNHRGQGSA